MKEKNFLRIYKIMAIGILILAFIQGTIGFIATQNQGEVTSFPWYTGYVFAMLTYGVPFLFCVGICIYLKKKESKNLDNKEKNKSSKLNKTKKNK